MIEKREYYEIAQGNGDKWLRVKLLGIECLKDSEKSKYIKFEMLKMIANDPTLTYCGDLDFEKFKMQYVIDRWVIEVEAILKKKEDN